MWKFVEKEHCFMTKWITVLEKCESETKIILESSFSKILQNSIGKPAMDFCFSYLHIYRNWIVQDVVLGILNQLFLEITLIDYCNQKQPSEMFYKKIKKVILKNFAVFTEIYLCWSLFLMKLQALRFVTLLQRTPTQLLSCEYHQSFKNSYSENICEWLFLCKSPFLSTIIFLFVQNYYFTFSFRYYVTFLPNICW